MTSDKKRSPKTVSLLTQAKPLGFYCAIIALLFYFSGLSQADGTSKSLQIAVKEHRKLEEELNLAHQELFEKMNQYYQAVRSKTPDSGQIASVSQSIQDSTMRINSTTQASYSNLDHLWRSITIDSNGKVEDYTAQSPGAENSADSTLSDKEQDAEPHTPAPLVLAPSKAPETGISSLTQGGTAGLNDSHFGGESPEIKDAQGPQLYVFKKQAPLPTPSSTPEESQKIK